MARPVTKKDLKQSSKRHIAKTITWRMIASITTYLLALYFFQDDAQANEKAMSIAITEAVLKMIFYYLHERAWFRSSFGLIKDKDPSSE